MIYELRDIIVCGLGVFIITAVEYWYALILKKNGRLTRVSSVVFVYLLVSITVSLLKIAMLIILVDREPSAILFATCIIQGAGCGGAISLAILLLRAGR